MKYLVFLLLVACGTEPQSNTAAQPTPAPGMGGNIDRADPPPGQTTIEYRKVGSTTYALAVADTKDIPPCTRDNNKQLVYVKNQDKFYSCEDDWVEIPIAGAQGAQGVAGTAGAQGPAGPQGPKGDPGQPVTVNIWADPTSSQRWFFGMSHVALDQVTSVCSGDWRLPTVAETQTAVLHGILIAASELTSGPSTLWTSEYSSPDGGGPVGRYWITTAGLAEIAGVSLFPSNGMPGVACIAVTTP